MKNLYKIFKYSAASIILSTLLATGCATNSTSAASYSEAHANAHDNLLTPPGLLPIKTDSKYLLIESKTINSTPKAISRLHVNDTQSYLVLSNNNINNVYNALVTYLTQTQKLTISTSISSTLESSTITTKIIQTDWKTVKPNISEGGIRGFLQKSGLNDSYALDTKYQFKFTLVQNGQDVWVFVAVYKADEVYVGCSVNSGQNIKVAPSGNNMTTWMMIPSSRGDEITVLSNIDAIFK